MKVSQMLPSTYLKKEDVESPLIVTIQRLEEVNVAPQGQPEERKWVIFFNEFDKGMVLNSTNIHLIVQATNCGDTDDWIGKEIVLYVDHSVQYAGKVIGGLRVRPMEREPARPVAPRRPIPQAAQASPRRAPSLEHADQEVPLAAMDDDIPY
jgi:hypothetical protein